MEFGNEEKLKLGGRSGTVGGTAWGAICGMSKYGSPHKAWMRIKGIDTPIHANAKMKRGIRLEPIIADVTANAIGLNLVEPSNPTVRWPKPYENFSASVDRDAYEMNGDSEKLGDYRGPVELKTMSMFGDWGENGPPEYVLQQESYCWERHLKSMSRGLGPVNESWLSCLQADEGVFGMIRNASDAQHAIDAGVAVLHTHRFERSDVFFEQVVPYVDWWFKKYVEGNTPPPVTDDSSDALEAIKKHYGFQPEKVCELNPEQLELIAEYERLTAEYKAQAKLTRDAEKAKKIVQAKVVESLAGFGKATSDGLVVSVSVTQSKRIDGDRIREELPEVFEQYQKFSKASAKVTIKRGGK